jgi:hypothetical protein
MVVPIDLLIYRLTPPVAAMLLALSQQVILE